MITRFWAGTRKAGSTRAHFQRHWAEVHAGFGLALPGLRAYVQNHVDGGPGTNWATPAFDGCSELSWDDLAAMREAFTSREMRDADRDEREFADPDRFAVFLGERRVLQGAVGDAGFRVLSFLRANPSGSKQRLAAALEAEYAQVVGGTNAACHEIFVAIDGADEPLACDVVDSLWFERREDALRLGDLGVDIGAALAGYAFGREVALVRSRRMRSIEPRGVVAR